MVFNPDLSGKRLLGGLWDMQGRVHGTKCGGGSGRGVSRVCCLAVVGGGLLKSIEILDVDVFLGGLGCVDSVLDKGRRGSIWLPHSCGWHAPLGTTGIGRTGLRGTLALVRQTNPRQVVLLHADGISHAFLWDKGRCLLIQK